MALAQLEERRSSEPEVKGSSPLCHVDTPVNLPPTVPVKEKSCSDPKQLVRRLGAGRHWLA